MTKLLITGAGGMLGANLVLDAVAAGHQVVAVDYGHPIRHRPVASVTADLARPGAAAEVFAAHRPDWAIHCAAATDVDACEANPPLAFRLNRDMAGQVALAAHAVGCRLVHVSTDAVFDGERGGYTEADEPRPINVYGHSKLDGELAVLAEHPQALVVRTNIYGWNAQPKLSLAEWFLERLEAGQTCPGFADAWFTPILVNDLGDRLLALLAKGVHGVLHVAGGECVSKLDFGRRLAAAFGFAPTRIQAAAVRDAQLGARRGLQMCLDSSRAAAVLAAPFPGATEGLDRFYAMGRQGRVAELRTLLLRPPVRVHGGMAE